MRSNNNQAIHYCCEYGHLKLAQWLVKTFNLNENDIKSMDDWALTYSCKNGHLEVVKWLVKKFYWLFGANSNSKLIRYGFYNFKIFDEFKKYNLNKLSQKNIFIRW